MPWPITDCGTYSGHGCAPVESLVDTVKPTFSNPTEITNPYYPISSLESVVFLGVADDLPFRSETTLLPRTATVVWDGQAIEVRLVQYLAYSNGKITEYALDRYAQSDDGAVWYFGEDVYDYVNGTVAVTEGTWLAGRDGSPAMIMPGTPKAGDVFRSETVLGVVFEEITLARADETRPGPSGPISGILVGSELHLDETRSDKLFAAGYGEFYTGNGHEVEALAVAAGPDRLSTEEPAELRNLLTAAWGVVESARLEQWEPVSAMSERIQRLWTAVSKVAPPLVAESMTQALLQLTAAVTNQDVAATGRAAADVAQAALDVQLRFDEQAAVDIARFHLHAQRLRLDAAAEDGAGVAAEVATLELILDRVAERLPQGVPDQVSAQLDQLRLVVSAGDLPAASDVAARSAAYLSGVAFGIQDWSRAAQD